MSELDKSSSKCKSEKLTLQIWDAFLKMNVWMSAQKTSLFLRSGRGKLIWYEMKDERWATKGDTSMNAYIGSMKLSVWGSMHALTPEHRILKMIKVIEICCI